MFNKKYEELVNKINNLVQDNKLSFDDSSELISALTIKDRDDKLVSDGTLNEGSGCSCHNSAPTISNGPINLPIKGFTDDGDPILDKNQMQILNGPAVGGFNDSLMPPCDHVSSPAPQGVNPFTNS